MIEGSGNIQEIFPETSNPNLGSYVRPSTSHNFQAEDIFCSIQDVVNEEYLFGLLDDVITLTYKQLKKINILDESKLRNRPIKKLLADGTTFYMHPCIDYTLLTVGNLREMWINEVWLIVDELSIPNWNLNYSLHFGIEAKIKNQLCFIDHTTLNQVRKWKWKFNGNYHKRWLSCLNTIKIHQSDISEDDNLRSLHAKEKLPLKHFSLNTLNILQSKIKGDHTPEEREKWFLDKLKWPVDIPEIIMD